MRLLIGFGPIRGHSRRFKVEKWVKNEDFAPGGGAQHPLYGADTQKIARPRKMDPSSRIYVKVDCRTVVETSQERCRNVYLL